MVAQARTDIVVLIVEDETDNREIMRTVVEDLLGYRALLVNDGALAIEAAAGQPHVILMDLMMPNLDGFEATRRIKGKPIRATSP